MPTLTTVLPELKYLYLSENRIVNISNNYFNNTPILQVLYLEENLLLSFPNFEPILTSLIYLYIRENMITLFNEQIYQMTNLQRLLLSDNHFQNITMQNIDSLTRLYVESTGLSKMPELKDNMPF